MRQPTDAELREALRLLRNAPTVGVPILDLARRFGGNGRGRYLMAEVQRRGLAAVIEVPGSRENPVYRVAATEEELQGALQVLLERRQKLTDRIAGLTSAFRSSVAQEELF